MENTVRYFIFLTVCTLMLSALGGCASKPIRHLASDASLVKPGISTKDDVLTFLGDPDAQQVISSSSERWVYYEERATTMQKTPYLGSLFGAKGYDQIVVTFEGDLVTDCRYSSYESDEFDWSDDYSWQEKRE